MKTHQRTRLASAVLAATSGFTMLALTMPADARDIEDELQDEALIFPYYTVRSGWTTLANVTNTSPYTIVAKVRYRESYNSRDVLDFNVILSPFDVWTGWVAEGPNGPRLSTRDNSCTTPIFLDAGDGSRYADFSNLGYQQDGGPKDIDRTREGHFEVITMAEFFPGSEDKKWSGSDSVSPGECWDGDGPGGSACNETPNTISWSDGDPKYPTAYYANHVDGQPRNCEMVDSRFVATASPFDIDDVVNGNDWSSDGDPLAEWDAELNQADWPACPPDESCGDTRSDAGDVLKGNFSLVNVGQGIAAGGIPVAVSMDCQFDDRDLITAQQFPWFLEPTLYSQGCDLWDWDRDISTDLSVDALNNEWSTNTKTGAATDWVVTFPTKEFHVDISETDIYAGVNPVRLDNADDGDCEQNNDSTWTCNIESEETEDSFMEAFLAAGGLKFNDSERGFRGVLRRDRRRSVLRYRGLQPLGPRGGRRGGRRHQHLAGTAAAYRQLLLRDQHPLFPG